jgi:hypothetical protein
MSEQGFFLVWEETSGYTKFRHFQKHLAEQEAERLAVSNPGRRFYILAPIEMCTTHNVQWEKMEYPQDVSELNPDGIPF